MLYKKITLPYEEIMNLRSSQEPGFFILLVWYVCCTLNYASSRKNICYLVAITLARRYKFIDWRC